MGGNLKSWSTTKKFTIAAADLKPGAYLTISGYDSNNERHCDRAGFALRCDNGVDSGSGWESVSGKSDFKKDDARRLGQGDGWAGVKTSKSGFYLKGDRSAPKIWEQKCQKYAIFRYPLSGTKPPEEKE